MKKILLILVLFAGIANATTYGDPIYKKCSQCSGVIVVEQLTSGNTFGAKYWTDGKRETPMLPDSLWLVKCPHCKASLWIDEQERTERTSSAKKYFEPGLSDYYKVLKDDKLSKKKESYIRIRAWWKSNDKRRGSQNNLSLSAEEKNNLKRLFELLSSDEYDFMKAEIKRELGEFEAAKEILDQSEVTKKSKKVESLMRELIDKKSTAVEEIRFNTIRTKKNN